MNIISEFIGQQNLLLTGAVSLTIGATVANGLLWVTRLRQKIQFNYYKTQTY